MEKFTRVAFCAPLPSLDRVKLEQDFGARRQVLAWKPVAKTPEPH